jgi:hypothetical protein
MTKNNCAHIKIILEKQKGGGLGQNYISHDGTRTESPNWVYDSSTVTRTSLTSSTDNVI